MGSSSASMLGRTTVSAAPWCPFRRLNSSTDTRRFLPAWARMVTFRFLPLLTYSGCTRYGGPQRAVGTGAGGFGRLAAAAGVAARFTWAGGGRKVCGRVSSAIVGIDGMLVDAGDVVSNAENAGGAWRREGRGGGALAALPMALGTGGARRLGGGGGGADILSLSVIVGLNTCWFSPYLDNGDVVTNEDVLDLLAAVVAGTGDEERWWW